MELKIDKAGRVVLPKPVRDRLGIREGSKLELVETAEGITLKPVSIRPSLVREGRFLVHTGRAPAGFDSVRAVSEERVTRLRKLSGL